jgi:hypothetical protein
MAAELEGQAASWQLLQVGDSAGCSFVGSRESACVGLPDSTLVVRYPGQGWHNLQASSVSTEAEEQC